jgi:iron complex outermembrane receptor protein
VYSSSIKSSVPNSTLDRILTANNITSLKFFINAVSTHTQGLDAVINLDKKIDDDIKMSLNLAFNANWNKIDSIMSPSEVLRLAKVAIFDRKEQSRILFARPDSKLLLNGSIEIGWFGFNANLTRYGKVTWQHIDNGLNKILGKSDTDFDQTFAAKSVIDISLQFKISKHLSFGLLANNVSNVYPDVIDTKGDFVTDLGGRFKYSWEVNQFGYLGRVYSMKLNLKL